MMLLSYVFLWSILPLYLKVRFSHDVRFTYVANVASVRKRRQPSYGAALVRGRESPRSVSDKGGTLAQTQTAQLALHVAVATTVSTGSNSADVFNVVARRCGVADS